MTLRIKGATTIKGLTSVNWSPNLLFAAGEQGVWYDPSDFSTMFQDTAGTTPVTATGQSVARINDKSGRGNNATQSDAASRPTLQIDGNGKYYLSFDGSNDNLVTGSINFSPASQVSAWAGVRKLNDTLAVVAELSATVGSNTNTFFMTTGLWPTGNDRYSFFSRGTGSNFNSFYAVIQTGTTPETAIIYGSGDIPGDTVTIRKNGVAGVNSTADQGGSGPYGNYPLYIGARAGSSLYLTGYLYGLIIRGAASTASQISMTETYMNSKTAAY